MTDIKLIIFDCDGILVDSEAACNDILIKNLARHGLSVTMTQCEKLFVGNSRADIAKIATHMGASLPENWKDEINQETYARLKKGIPLVKGIVNLLDRLDAADIAYCVASNGSDEKMEITLGQTGLLERFINKTFSAYSLSISKPNPDLFLHAANVMKVATKNCIIIEDSPLGARGARLANIKCYGYSPYNDGKSLALEGAVIFDDMEKLPALLNL